MIFNKSAKLRLLEFRVGRSCSRADYVCTDLITNRIGERKLLVIPARVESGKEGEKRLADIEGDLVPGSVVGRRSLRGSGKRDSGNQQQSQSGNEPAERRQAQKQPPMRVERNAQFYCRRGAAASIHTQGPKSES